MIKVNSEINEKVNQNFKIWQVGITFRVMILLFVLVIIPMSLTSWLFETGILVPGKNAYFFVPILFLVLLQPMSRLIAHFFINKDLMIINKYCREIKDGNYQIHFSFKQENDNEDQFILLLRNLTWMSLRLNCEYKEAQVRYQDVKEKYDDMEVKARTDALTGLYNRRHFDDILSQKVHYSILNEYSVSLIFIDFDKFKALNDTLGHQVGDLALKTLANCLEQAIRLDRDMAFRFGGDEFAVILSEADEKMTKVVARRIARMYRESQVGETTLSIGIASSFFTQESHEEELLELIKNADSQAYEAKHLGGDCIQSISLLGLKHRIA